MADEIKNTLGFDASQALFTLSLLDAGFERYTQRLAENVDASRAFNRDAGKNVSALYQIATKANQAADALARLNAIRGGATVAPAALGNTAGAASGANAVTNALNQTQNAANAAGSAVTNAANQGATALNKAAKSGNGYALSLETIGRVVGTQVIVRALNSIRTATEESFQGFIDFNRTLAEIQSISPEPIDNVRRSVRALADEFGAPILDVAKAKYDIISNGFQTAAESNAILIASLKLSRLGISDVAQAADLLATILNAYGREASYAETLSAKLFRTVDVGRVTISELTTAFGRVAPIAAEIGATEDEILASFAAITIGGAKADEAATQIRATLTALLKPSEAGAEALRKLGFSTGEQAIRAYGLNGALQQLIATTDGSASAAAKLFPNVRALNGVLRLTGTGAEAAASGLEQISEASREVLNTKYEIRVSSDAEQVSQDLERVKNFFTDDIGERLVKITGGFIKMVGGIEVLISAFDRFVPLIGVTVGSLVLYQTAALVVTGINKGLATSFADVGAKAALAQGAVTGAIAIFAAYSAGNFIGDQITAKLLEPFEAQKKASEDFLLFQKNQSEARLNLDRINIDKQFQTINQGLAVSRRAYFQQEEIARDSNKRLLDDNKATLDKILEVREKYASDLKRAAEQANADILDSRERVADLEADLEDRQFKNSIKRLNDHAKARENALRADDLSSQAGRDLSTAGTAEERDAALSAFNRAQSFAEAAISAAETTNNYRLQIEAEQNLEDIMQRRIAAETSFQKKREADAEKLRAAAAAEEARLSNLKQLAKDILDNSSVFTDRGELLDKDQIAQNVQEAKQALEQFKAQAFQGSGFDVNQLLAFDRLEQRLAQTLTGNEVQSLFASDQALNTLVSQVQGTLDAVEFQVSLTMDPASFEGLDLNEKMTRLDNEASFNKDELVRLGEGMKEREAAEQRIKQLSADAAANYERQQTAAEKLAMIFKTATVDTPVAIFSGTGNGFDAANKVREDLVALEVIRAEVQQGIADTTFNQTKLEELAARATAFQEQASGAAALEIAKVVDYEFAKLVEIVAQREKLNELTNAGITQEALDFQMNYADQWERAEAAMLRAKEATGFNVQGTDAAAKRASDLSASTDSAAASTARIAANMNAAADAAVRAAAASRQIGGGNVEPVGRAFGGTVQRYAEGGLVSPSQASGTDNVPAMLTKGELVLNAQASQRFFSQAQAMNAGYEPQFQGTTQQGDTFNVGDIVVNGSSDPQATAREVMSAIRREQRKGTARLGK